MIRVSLYDPSYFAPMQSSYMINLNYPPTLGHIQIIPKSGFALNTTFSIIAKDYLDDELPLSYKFSYYTDYNDYILEKFNGSSSMSLKKNTLSDFSEQNSL